MKFKDFPYLRPDIEETAGNLDRLIKDFEKAASLNSQLRVMEEINGLRKNFESQASLAYIRHTQNTADPTYSEENQFIDEALPVYEKWVTRYYKALLDSTNRKELENRLGSQLFRMAEIKQLAFRPEILEDMQKENRLTSEYVKLLASAQIPFQGELRTLTQMTPFEESSDRDTRRKALASRFGFFEEKGEELDQIFDRLVKLRTSMGRKMGYENYNPLGYARMSRTGYTEKDVKRFRKGVRNYLVPVAEELYKRQWKRIGLKKGKIWDKPYRYSKGNPTPGGDKEWMVERASQMYREMSPETDKFFQFMVERELLDLEARKGKAGGGYCDMLPEFGSPFIFSNFNGTSGDVDVLTHEAGHAFQCFSSRDLPLDSIWPTYEACEVHSMSMEYFAWPWMELFFGEEADKYRYDHLSEFIKFIPYGVSVDEFQHRIYQNPEATPEKRHRIWLEMEKVYQPSLDNAGIPYLEKGGFWQKQGHIFKTPFYYIDYTLAETCAMQYWVWMQKDRPAAWESYKNLCSRGGTESFLELIGSAGLRSPFQETLFRDILKDIRPWLEGVDTTDF